MRRFIIRAENNKFTFEGEIVHCKECRNRHRQKRCAGRHPNWFCADGVKQVASNLESKKHQLKKRAERIKVEPKPVCEDAISRADTINAMCQECKVFPDDDVNCADCTEVAIVKGMPPVEPKRPKGEWVDRNDEDAWNYCSVCGEQSIDLFDFCPNCGCDCRGDKE